MRLWLRRRLANPRNRAVLVVVLAAIVFAAAVGALVLSSGGTVSNQRGTSRGGTQPGGPGAGAIAAATVRHRAAAWVVQQVSGTAVAACDPAMCGALSAAGVPAGRLIVLRPGQGDPLGSDVVVATAAVRNLFGSRLASVYAPVVVASFGTGAAAIQIRAVAPDGAAAYLAALRADVQARRAAGAEILHNSAIRVSPAARRQLSAGQVDTRLLVTLVTLSHTNAVDVIGFGAGAGAGSGAGTSGAGTSGAGTSGVSAGVPLRFAEITGTTSRSGRSPASIETLRAFLTAQRPPYRPSWVTTVRLASRTVLRIEYPAPSPLGLLGSHG